MSWPSRWRRSLQAAESGAGAGAEAADAVRSIFREARALLRED